MTFSIKKVLQNFTIALLALSNILNIVWPYLGRLRSVSYMASSYLSVQDVDLSRVLIFTLSALGILLAYKLYQRMRFAWMIELIVQSSLLILHSLALRRLSWPLIVVNLLVLAVLMLGYKDFSRASDRLSRSRALILAAGVLTVVLLNTVLSLFLLQEKHFTDRLQRSVLFLFTMDARASGYRSSLGLIYANTVIVIFWVFIIGTILLLLKPLIVDPWAVKNERREAYGLVTRFGYNPLAYLALENDKKYFFGHDVEGLVAYRVENGIFICCGDPICAKKDINLFLVELLGYTRKNGLGLTFLAVTDDFLAIYQDFGFTVEKIGEDAVVELANYSLKGGKIAKVRAAINLAKKHGVRVEEYQPNQARNLKLEGEMNEISRLWFREKGEKIGFIIGGLGLAQPLGRRYFYAVDDESGQMLSFVVLLPYAEGQGYLVDITRRRPGIINGAMQMTVVEAFLALKAEGVRYGNLGLCTLANVKEEGARNSFAVQLFSFVYENVRRFYDFKGLYQAKKKFAPTDWQARYLVFSQRNFSPRLVYAILRAQGFKLRRGKKLKQKAESI